MNPSIGTLSIVKEENVAVPMRDGIILRANVFRPSGEGQYPSLLLRTPYGKPSDGYDRYVRAGYVVITQDSRGRYASEGSYVPFTEIDTGDAEDGYDSVEWLAQQPYCNGRVGTLGASYNAWMQWMLARLKPPHLVAMCAYSIPLELTQVDWMGAFRPARRIKWWMTTMAPDLRRRHGWPPPHTPAEAVAIWEDIEKGRWLEFLPWIDIVKYLPPGLAEYAQSWLEEPHRRAWDFESHQHEVDVPNLDFSGWYDHCNGTMGHLAGMQERGGSEASRNGNQLVIGPWNHVAMGERRIGGIDFGADARLDLTDMIIRWFDYWLKGLENGVDGAPPVRYFVMGSAQWKEAETWPLPNLREDSLYLDSSGAAGVTDNAKLARAKPQLESVDTYDYDPNDPVPTLWDASLFTVPSDRRTLEYRSDILYYRTEPLNDELEVVGYPRVVLFAASTARDTDFFARLVDEHPDGVAIDVCYGMIRARHRKSLEEEHFLVPGEVTQFEITLGATACRFMAGHRIRIEITSSDFPNHDRNHNTGKNDLKDAQLLVAHQQIFHSTEYPSRLLLPVDTTA